MSVDKIKNLDSLLDLPSNYKILNQKVRRFTAAGENYGSLMLRVDITIQTPNGIEELYTVAKMVPPNEFIQKIFDTPLTFRNEIGFYKEIIPTLQDFQRSHGVEQILDITAKFYGARLNLNNDDSGIDSEAALILKNLKKEGFAMKDRLEGLDLDEIKLILNNLAQLHATSLAFKQQNPEVFQKKIRPYISYKVAFPQIQIESVKRNLRKLIKEVDILKPLEERIIEGFDKFLKEPTPNEDFATVVQNDCWINNNLFKYENNNKAIKNILVDFQICIYGSPAMDVLLLIYSSAKNEVIKNNYEELINFYYKNFISVLLQLKCDVAKYSFENFSKELDWAGKNHEAGKLAYMLLYIYAPETDAKDVEELSIDSMSFDRFSKTQKEKYAFVFTEFAKKGWI